MKKYLATAIAVLAMAPVSQAAVVSFGGQNVSIPSNFGGVYIDLQTGSTNTSPFAGGDINFFFGGEGISNDADAGAAVPTLQFVRVGTANNDAAANSPLGALIGPGSTFSTGFGSSGNPNDHLGTQFTAGSRGFLGFSLDNAGTANYGFLDVTLTANGAGVVHGWQYDDSGAPIVIPEPATGLLSALALGLLILRRRR